MPTATSSARRRRTTQTPPPPPPPQQATFQLQSRKQQQQQQKQTPTTWLDRRQQQRRRLIAPHNHYARVTQQQQQQQRTVQKSPQHRPKRSLVFNPSSWESFLGWMGTVLIVALAVWIYAFPIFFASVTNQLEQQQLNNGGGMILMGDTNEDAILNERHLTTNPDVLGQTPWWAAFGHDYWGNPLLLHRESQEEESAFHDTHHQHHSYFHKSWRPLTILSLRYLSTIPRVGWFSFLNHNHKIETDTTTTTTNSVVAFSPLIWARFLNVVLHSHISLLVGVVGSQLLPSKWYWMHKWTEWMCCLIFLLHPSHVEAVANVANRPHLLALTFSLSTILAYIAHNPPHQRGTNPYLTSGILWTLGLLCSETTVLQLPAVMTTVVVWKWKQGKLTMRGVWRRQRYLQRLWVAITLVYLMIRHFLLVGGSLWPLRLHHQTMTPSSSLAALTAIVDTPFAELVGWDRWRSYLYVVSIHIGKVFGVDPIGFAHEYSRGCVDPLESWNEPRGWIVLGVVFSVLTTTVDLTDRPGVPELAYLWGLALAWVGATILPVCGIVPVHTFVADRLLLPATVMVSWVGGYWCAGALCYARGWKVRIPVALVVFGFLGGFWGQRVLDRVTHWTDHQLLFQKTLEACPRSPKILVQYSQFHSNPERRDQLNLGKALELVQLATEVDEDSSYCPAQYQYARVFVQLGQYRDMEPYLAKARACPSTAVVAEQMWNEYWSRVLPNDPEAQHRHQQYTEWLQLQPQE